MKFCNKVLLLSFFFSAGKILAMESVALQEPVKEMPRLTAEQLQKIIENIGKYVKNKQEVFSGLNDTLETIRQEMPRYDITGGLDYFMSVDEIRNVAVEKLSALRAEKRLLTQEEFDKFNKSDWFQIRRTPQNLARIWGGDYLAKKFKELDLKTFKVPEYIMVVPSLKDMKVNVTLKKCYPVLMTLEKGQLYAQKIDGVPAAHESRLPLEIGYEDYEENDNILKTAADERFVVDTEYKSFAEIPFAMKAYYGRYGDELCPFLSQRFEMLHKDQIKSGGMFLKALFFDVSLDN